MSEARTLVVMRHAKAEDAAVSDVQRRLTEAGVVDAADAGVWLAARGVVPERALVSAAVRTVETWRAVAAAARWDLDPAVDDALYETSPQTVLDLVRDVSDDAATVLVVGHNPTMASLSLLLDDGLGDDDAAAEMPFGFPTAAVAVFGYAGRWADLAPGGARLHAFHSGRA